MIWSAPCGDLQSSVQAGAFENKQIWTNPVKLISKE